MTYGPLDNTNQQGFNSPYDMNYGNESYTQGLIQQILGGGSIDEFAGGMNQVPQAFGGPYTGMDYGGGQPFVAGNGPPGQTPWWQSQGFNASLNAGLLGLDLYGKYKNFKEVARNNKFLRKSTKNNFEASRTAFNNRIDDTAEANRAYAALSGNTYQGNGSDRDRYVKPFNDSKKHEMRYG